MGRYEGKTRGTGVAGVEMGDNALVTKGVIATGQRRASRRSQTNGADEV